MTPPPVLCRASAGELAALIHRRAVSPLEVVDEMLARIDALNSRLNAYCLVLADAARATARRAEAALMRGEMLGPLHGVPVSIKDLVFTRGVRTTFGSKLHADLVPDISAPAVERLEAAGAIVLGKTTTPEFGYKPMTDSPLLGATLNPWNPALTPSGSSGGGAVAVATGMGPLALGTDGGGSIRTPASFCGIFGLKPTFGRVALAPLSGWEALDYRCEHHGPLTRTVADAALMLDVIAGPAPADATSLPRATTRFTEGLGAGIKGLRVAWSPGFNGGVVDPGVLAITERAARRFGELGAHVEDATPALEPLHEVYQTLFAADCAAALAPHFEKSADALDRGLVRLVEMGRRVTGEQYAACQSAVHRATAALGRFFERWDLVLTPTSPVPPFPVRARWPHEIAGQKVHPLALLAYTYPLNLSGQPAASVPCGFTADGLPVGLQIVGRRFEESTVLRAAAACEAAWPWADRWPGA